MVSKIERKDSTINILTEVLHCDNGISDKVYIVEVNHIKDLYIVSATWGKRTALRLASQIKAEYNNQYAALSSANKLLNDKKRSKDKYDKAKSNLVIPGFMRGAITTVDIHVDSTTVPRTATITSTDESSTRKIRL